MEKEMIRRKLKENHTSFTDYLLTLPKEAYEFSVDNKWTAGQQLEHIVLCVKALVDFFNLDRAIIEQKFGITARHNLSYDTLSRAYMEQSAGGVKAPARYIPGTNTISERESFIKTLEGHITELGLQIETFSDEELDRLQIPHPALGILTLREMLYNAIYHVEHHMMIAKSNLEKQ